MNIQAFVYKVKSQFTFVLWYLGIYLPLMLSIYFILYKTSYLGPNEGSYIYRIWGSTIFLWAISIRFKEDFDFLLTMSYTRKEIYAALSGTAVVLSGIFSALIVLERVLVDFLNSTFSLYNITDPIHRFSPYANGNFVTQFLFFFTLCLCGSVFGILLGSLFYRFGKRFVTSFWLAVLIIPTAFLPMVIWHQHFSGFLPTLGKFLTAFDIVVSSGYQVLLTVIFGIAALLHIQKLPQK